MWIGPRPALFLAIALVSLSVAVSGATGCFVRRPPASPTPAATPVPPAPSPSPTATPAPAQTFTATPTLNAKSADQPARPVLLPDDDAPHPDATTEWWYYNGRLEASGGRQFGFHYALFVVRIPGLPPVRIAHFAVTDVEGQTHAIDQRSEFGSGPVASDGGFDFDIRGWRMAGSGGSDLLIAQAGGYAIRLELEPAKPAVLHGGTGSLDVSTAGQTSHYYSRTRMGAAGTVSTGEEALEVEGEAWFDHQWGNFSALAIGWDWFALQLDDGAEVMMYRIRDAGTGDRFDYGTFVGPDGQASELAGEDFEISARDTWTSPATGIEYPSRWTVDVPSRGVQVEIGPLVEASEFDARVTTRNVYWEGLVRVTGSHSGWGFVELVGYVPPTTAPR